VKIVSGGQTGVDRAALDVAIARGIAYGGWCPLGGWAEDFQARPGLLAKYPALRETSLRDPARRTRWNVRDSDRTLIIAAPAELAASRGTNLTLAVAERLGRPHLVADPDDGEAPVTVAAWLREGGAALVLNIAGPRESGSPGIYRRARYLIEDALDRL
jgi:hypothetical protein